jgi:hypothetical protein
MIHTCNLSYSGSGDQEDSSLRTVQVKCSEDPISEHHFSYTESINRITVQAHLGKKPNPIPKIIKAKRAGDMTQMVEHLPSNHKTLTSNPSVPH